MEYRRATRTALPSGKRTSVMETMLQETDITAEQKRMGQAVAAGTVMGLGLGLIIALFTI